MEVVLGWYLLFAFTTGFVALYELIVPIMRELEDVSPSNNLIENKIVAYMLFVSGCILFAPVVIFPCIIPNLGVSFRRSLLNELRKA
jgi:hypothetical protein